MATLPLALTYDEAKAALQAVADEAPERTIRDMGGACVYFVPTDRNVASDEFGDLMPGEGCCIVGRLLERQGVTYDDMMVDHKRVNDGYVVADLVHHGLLELDDRTAMLLDIAQAYQDNGKSWADATRMAIVQTDAA